MSESIHVVVVGQTPPPYGGQAIMIEKILAGSYVDVELHHVRLAFSGAMGDMGHFRVRKVIHLVAVIWRVISSRVSTKAEVLYYPPAGPSKVPMFRDMLILLATRRLFRKTIFHFHAGGLSTLYADLPGWQQLLFRLTYFVPDAAIRMGPGTPPDAAAIRARREFIVPHGIEDVPVKDSSLKIPPVGQRHKHRFFCS